jgi:hypothetical protein
MLQIHSNMNLNTRLKWPIYKSYNNRIATDIVMQDSSLTGTKRRKNKQKDQAAIKFDTGEAQEDPSDAG